jgi:hypothetical protein
MPLLIYLRHVVSTEHRTILYTLQQGIPCYLIQSHLSHISRNYFSWIHFKITNLLLSTECFTISSIQNSVHFVFNPRMQHDLPCCNGVQSYDTSFCSGHIFGGESFLYWFRNHCPRKSCSAYYSGPKGKVLQINKSFVSRSPSKNKTVGGTWKNSRTTRTGVGIGDDFPQTVPQLRRLSDGFLRYELDFEYRTVYFKIFVGKMAMELDVS